MACFVLDSVREWSKTREEGDGRGDHLNIGTAATVVFLEDSAPVPGT